MKSETEKIVSMLFTCMFYESEVWNNGRTQWLGVPVYQNPMDLFMMQEMICWVKPTIIIETGTFYGGSALYYAHVLEKVDKKAKIITIDIEKNIVPSALAHPQITFIHDSSLSIKTLNKVRKMVKKKDRVMVLLDSDHSSYHVLEELRAYSDFVTSGSYMVVHDTFLGGNPIVIVSMKGDRGPMEAVNSFLKENKDFNIDHARGKFMFSFCPNGCLLRR